MPLIAQFGSVPMLIAMLALLALSLSVGLLYFGRKDPDPHILERAGRSD